MTKYVQLELLRFVIELSLFILTLNVFLLFFLSSRVVDLIIESNLLLHCIEQGHRRQAARGKRRTHPSDHC